jgi:hypothetical protein
MAEEKAQQERTLALTRAWARLSPGQKAEACRDRCLSVRGACAAGSAVTGAILHDAFGGGLGGMMMADALTEDCDETFETCLKTCVASDLPPG